MNQSGAKFRTFLYRLKKLVWEHPVFTNRPQTGIDAPQTKSADPGFVCAVAISFSPGIFALPINK